MDESLKVGDVVRLKSGGPLMTVRALDLGDGSNVDCVWFVADKKVSGIFPPETLEIDETILL